MIANLRRAVDVLRDTDKTLKESLDKQFQAHRLEIIKALATEGFYVLKVGDGRSFRITKDGNVKEESSK